MKKLFRRFLGAAMTAALVLSLCVTAMAAQTTPPYAHLSVGAAKVASELKKGDTVRIPVSVAGIKEDQWLAGFGCTVKPMSDGYLEITDIEFSNALKAFTT